MPKLEPKEFDHVVDILSNAISGAFAFVVKEGVGFEPSTIYYAINHGPWSCIVNLIQYAKHSNVGHNLPCQTIYISYNAEYNGTAAEGMCNFFGITIKPVNKAAHSDSMMIFSNDRMESCPFAKFYRIDCNEVLYRDDLDDFIKLKLGPCPSVSLGGIMSTHFHRLYMAVAFYRVKIKFERWEQGLAIAAVLVNKNDGQVRAIAHNTKYKNETFHAELNLIQAFIKHYEKERNDQFVLYSTLQPCPMCSAMIAQMLPNTIVFYGQQDPGSHMQGLALQPSTMVMFDSTVILTDTSSDERREYSVKPLRVFANPNGKYSYNDVCAQLNQIHNKLKEDGNNALTRNLYDTNSIGAIKGASNTIQRKVSQYIVKDKSKELYVDPWRLQRRSCIKKIMEHLLPVFQFWGLTGW